MPNMSMFAGGGNVGAGWGPPSGMAALIAQDRDIITSGGRELGPAMSRLAGAIDQHKREQSLGKAAESFVAGMGGEEFLSQYNLDPVQFKNLSATDKMGFVSGIVQQQAQRSLMQRLGQEQQAMRAEAQAPGAVESYMSTLARLGPGSEQQAIAAVAAGPAREGLRSRSFWESVGSIGGDSLRQFNAETSRMRAEADRTNAEAFAIQTAMAANAGPEPPKQTPPERSITVSTRTATGDTVTRRLTPEEYAAVERELENTPKAREQAVIAAQQRQALEQERAEHIAKIAAGDTRFGLANFSSRINRLKEIERELAKLPPARAANVQRPTSNVQPPPAAAIEYLRANPNLTAAFDEKYGAGASARYLSQ